MLSPQLPGVRPQPDRYNSCRNRHCPKCQGTAAEDWLAAREADLLPVGYFHLVFSLPAEIAPIAYHNKAAVYGLLFRAAAQTLLTIAADPRHLGARIGATAVLHRVRRARRHALGAVQIRLPVAGEGIVPPVPATRRRPSSSPKNTSRPAAWASARSAGASAGVCPAPRAAQKEKNWFVYAKPPFAGRRRSRLSRPLHSPRRHLEQPPARSRRARRHLSLQGLSPQWAGAVPHDDARSR